MTIASVPPGTVVCIVEIQGASLCYVSFYVSYHFLSHFLSDFFLSRMPFSSVLIFAFSYFHFQIHERTKFTPKTSSLPLGTFRGFKFRPQNSYFFFLEVRIPPAKDLPLTYLFSLSTMI